jgi:exonuclease VII small subunit
MTKQLSAKQKVKLQEAMQELKEGQQHLQEAKKTLDEIEREETQKR